MIPEKKKPKCAIVGTSDSWKMAPYNDPDWEIWGVNNFYILLSQMEKSTKADRWFEIHDFQFDGNNFFRRGDQGFRGKKVVEYLKEMASLNIPIFMQKHWDLIPLSIEYPFEEILKMFPRKYFTNTISWELGLAIAMDFKEIGCWGVDMSVGSEWYYQRPSVEYFLGIIEGKGIPLTIPAEADLLKTLFMYGLEEKRQGLFEKKIKGTIEAMNGRHNQARAIMEQKRDEVNQYVGAISGIKEF